MKLWNVALPHETFACKQTKLMKKILSTLVMCLIFGVGYSYGITVTAKAVVYDQILSNQERVQGGGNVIVYVANNYEKGWLSSSWEGWSDGTPAGTDTYSTWIGNPMSGGDKNGQVCYSASVENTSNGYFFYQWEETDGSKITEKSSRDRDIKNTEISADKTVYAVFKPVTVDNPNNGTINVTDLSPATKDGTVTFNVTGADNINDFYTPTVEAVEGEGFAYKSMSYANNVITVTVTYTVQNKDNVNGDPKPSYSATVTLRSKGDADGTQAKQATITATESLKPAFSIPATLNLTPDAPALAVAPAQQSFTITTNNQVAANASWDATLPQEAKDLGFSVEKTGTAVTVNFTPKDNIYQEDILATLSITGIYTDGNEKIITNTQIVSLSADKGSAVKIDGKTNASCDFGTKEYTGQAYTKDLSFTSNIIATDLSYLWFPDDFEHEVKGNIITITLPGKLIPGNYSGELSVKYNAVDVAYLTASAKVRLAQPQIESKVYMSQVLLTWKNVYGAKQYILKSGETVIDISDVMTSETIATASTSASHTRSYCKMITAIGDAPLSTGTEYPFTLTVVYGDDVNNINDVTKISSTTITATPAATTTITADDVPLLGIYTGTEKAGAYPYHKDGKRLIDLSAAFKDGVAAFDKLYVFGLTSGDANNIITPPNPTSNSNAVTPCYIYIKKDGNYSLSTTIPNVNVATKPQEFTISASSIKSVYFTGYAPYATCGYTWDENGVFEIQGGANQTIDVYLDNFKMYSRPKAEVGTKLTEKILGLSDIDGNIDLGDISNTHVFLYTNGSGAALAFVSSSENENSPFKPTIHLRGDNFLESTYGVATGVDIEVKIPIINTVLVDVYYDPVTNASAPIHIVPKGSGGYAQCTSLTINDKWHADGTSEFVATNGKLKLSDNLRPAPTIDLGNDKTKLTFDGGQIFLQNAAISSETYTTTYAISYRYKEMKEIAFMYGLGDDQPGGKVHFKDGTISCAEIPLSVWNGTFKDRYETCFYDRFSMKCPINTVIDGGTFNCNVLASSSTKSSGGAPMNSAGHKLCKTIIDVTSDEDYPKSTNGLVSLPANWLNNYYYNSSTNLTTYYTNNSSKVQPYSVTSIVPLYNNETEQYEVNLMLPNEQVCISEIITKPWVVCVPEFKVGGNAVGQILGGSVDKVYSGYEQNENVPSLESYYETSKLLYGVMDEYVQDVSSTYTSPTGMSVSVEDITPSEISETESYAIKDKVYYLLPVVANEWKLFTAPFDISNVYLIESYPEEQLLKDFGEEEKDKKGNSVWKIKKPEQIKDARLEQSSRFMDFMYNFMWDVDGLGNSNDFWTKSLGKDYSEFVKDWIEYEKTNARNKDAEGNYTPKLTQLYHYSPDGQYPDGVNWWDANFYLYESYDDVPEYKNVWDFNGESFVTKWKEVSTVSIPRGKNNNAPKVGDNHNVIMKRGEVYAIDFPYSVTNAEYDHTQVWDYWTGKYILFEGFPTIDTNEDGVADCQIINGSDYASNIKPSVTSGTGVISGNSTFAYIELEDENTFILNGYGGNKYDDGVDYNAFVPASYVSLRPAESFILTSPVQSNMPTRRITSINPRTGEITYRNETATSVPTIGGNNQMFVYNITGGVGVVPVVAQQVSIYNAAGQLVTSQYLTDEVHIPLPSGIYLIAGAKDQFKAVVK